MTWRIELHEEFEAEFDELPEAVQDELLARARLLEAFGPDLGRSHVDTLKGSAHANMKERRFNAGGGVWRAAFAFDPRRTGVLLACGDKSGGGEKRFYKTLIRRADRRLADRLTRLGEADKPKKRR